METHKETIKCPNCGHIQEATVIHSQPFAKYIHHCLKCGYMIMESEWEKVYPQEYIVIADYPDSNFKIGDVLRFNGITWGTGEPQQFINNPEKYPNIFKTKNKHLKQRW
jgi:hypothetical protein